MVRIPRTGRSVCAIYERTPAVKAMIECGLIDPNECVTTLGEVITHLGLKVLSSDDEQRIRNELATVIGTGLSNIEYSPKLNPDGRLQVSDVQKTLFLLAVDCRTPGPDKAFGADGHAMANGLSGVVDEVENPDQSRSRRCTGALGIVRGLIFPRQFVERRLVASCPVAILRNVEFLVLVIFYAGTVLIAPAVTFSVEAARFHKDRIPSNAPACHIVRLDHFKLR
jgi:hypothetical protein